MFVYRDEVYNEDTEQKGVAEIIIGKQRNGPIGTKLLSFIGKFTRFENYMPMNDDFGGGGYYGQAASAPSSSAPAHSQNITPDFGPDAFDDGDAFDD